MISGHMLTDGAPACSTSANLRRRSTCSRAETDDGTPGTCSSPTTAVVVGAEADCETPGLGQCGHGRTSCSTAPDGWPVRRGFRRHHTKAGDTRVCCLGTSCVEVGPEYGDDHTPGR
jgi:hypothetical protein